MQYIKITGARQHNLKDIDVCIPKEKLVVITGVSGSGKSSLAFDTIYAEGQRRYVESLSAYARQFIELMPKADFDAIEGLAPAIAVQQKTISKNPRSTVGTITEIYDYLRLLYATIGVPFSPATGLAITAMTTEEMADSVESFGEDQKVNIIAPIISDRKGEHKEEIENLIKDGFSQIIINGKSYAPENVPPLARTKKHDIKVVIDRIVLKPSSRTRIIESLELAKKLGNGVIHIECEGKTVTVSSKFSCPVSGFTIEEMTHRLFSFNTPQGACKACNGLGYIDDEFGINYVICDQCSGKRLCSEALCVKIYGMNIAQLCDLSIQELYDWIIKAPFDDVQKQKIERVTKEIINRTKFLVNVGLEYLSLSRLAGTLSGGESQRIRLASQIGSGLTGVLYVLDEPSIGLHQSDNRRLIEALKTLRDLGNTVIVVEHDEEIMRACDYIIDVGPGPGVQGGRIVGSGSPLEIQEVKDSLTAEYLRGKRFTVQSNLRKPIGWINITGAMINNIVDLNVKIPLGVVTCVTGISGSGKSSLVNDVVARSVLFGKPTNCKAFNVDEDITTIVLVDQQPIGRTPKSNPATYVGALNPIRDFYASLPESVKRGFGPGRFSFNTQDGGCIKCRGEGAIKIDMHFLPDVFIECEICKGKRYQEPSLAVRYRGKNIADVLDMTVAEAVEFFDVNKKVLKKLVPLEAVGLGYIRLGQSATTLSGGEAQRVKLAKELGRPDYHKALYILDEPTTGLHFADVEKLMHIINTIAEKGHTFVIIEHNVDVIRCADYIIDMGPHGGANGGKVVACGTPSEIANNPSSVTGQYILPIHSM